MSFGLDDSVVVLLNSRSIVLFAWLVRTISVDGLLRWLVGLLIASERMVVPKVSVSLGTNESLLLS